MIRIDYVKAGEILTIDDSDGDLDATLAQYVKHGFEEEGQDLIPGITTFTDTETETVLATVRYYQEDKDDAYPTLVVTRFRGWMCDAWEKYRRVEPRYEDMTYTVERVA